MKTYIFNNENITYHQGVVINDIWHPMTAVKIWPYERLEDFGITVTETIETQFQPNQEDLLLQAREQVRSALQEAINKKARSFGFSEGNALMLYAGFTNPFQVMAKKFAIWEASVWVEANQYKEQVLLGAKPMVSGEEAVAMMPTYPN